MIVVSIAILFGVSVAFLVHAQNKIVEYRFDNDQISSAAIVYGNAEYTLNSEQTEELIKLLDAADNITAATEKDGTAGKFEKIVLYRFEGKEPIILQSQNAESTLFSVSVWNKDKQLEIAEPKELSRLVEQAHD